MILRVLMLDDGTQFCIENFKKFCKDLQIKQKFMLVEHPQTNGLVESTNWVTLKGLKKRLDSKKGA